MWKDIIVKDMSIAKTIPINKSANIFTARLKINHNYYPHNHNHNTNIVIIMEYSV